MAIGRGEPVAAAAAAAVVARDRWYGRRTNGRGVRFERRDAAVDAVGRNAVRWRRFPPMDCRGDKGKLSIFK